MVIAAAGLTPMLKVADGLNDKVTSRSPCAMWSGIGVIVMVVDVAAAGMVADGKMA